MISTAETAVLVEFNGGVYMKTRIISGAVIVLLSALALGASIEYPVVITVVGGILTAFGVYEALYATGIVKNKVITSTACVFSAFYVCKLLLAYLNPVIAVKISASPVIFVVFSLVQFALYLKFHKNINLSGMLGMIVLPIIIAYGFDSFCSIVRSSNKLFYVILVLCWSAIADTGAYFTGVAFGKHKMAPVVSPKKSWEGLIGGMAFSLLAVFLVCMLYNNLLDVKVNTALTLMVTPIFVLIGVLGDLTASLIKRKCDIKDFGKLIPGHGGILDRFDSILMISAAFSVLTYYISL